MKACVLALLTLTFAPATLGQQLPPPVPSFATWTDPTEHAFQVRIPQGWNISGATVWHSPIDARNYVAAQSPDRKVAVWIDDPGILPRQVPNPAYYRLGYFEGRTVQSPGGPLKIERFLSGAQFAQEFVRGKICQAPAELAAFDLAQETRRMNLDIAPLAARAGVRAVASAGEYIFHCGDKYGYAYAVTVLAWTPTTPGGPQNWAVYKLAGYLSDKSEVEIARCVMNEMRASFTMNPVWQQQAEQRVHDASGALMEMSNRITQASIAAAQQSLQRNMQMVQERQQQFDRTTEANMDSFHRQMDSQDRIRQRWSDITLGQIHGCDNLGNCGEVSNDYDHYWTRDGKTVVGGPSDGSPPNHDPSYREWKPDY